MPPPAPQRVTVTTPAEDVLPSSLSAASSSPELAAVNRSPAAVRPSPSSMPHTPVARIFSLGEDTDPPGPDLVLDRTIGGADSSDDESEIVDDDDTVNLLNNVAALMREEVSFSNSSDEISDDVESMATTLFAAVRRIPKITGKFDREVHRKILVKYADKAYKAANIPRGQLDSEICLTNMKIRLIYYLSFLYSHPSSEQKIERMEKALEHHTKSLLKVLRRENKLYPFIEHNASMDNRTFSHFLVEGDFNPDFQEAFSENQKDPYDDMNDFELTRLKKESKFRKRLQDQEGKKGFQELKTAINGVNVFAKVDKEQVKEKFPDQLLETNPKYRRPDSFKDIDFEEGIKALKSRKGACAGPFSPPISLMIDILNTAEDSQGLARKAYIQLLKLHRCGFFSPLDKICLIIGIAKKDASIRYIRIDDILVRATASVMVKPMIQASQEYQEREYKVLNEAIKSTDGTKMIALKLLKNIQALEAEQKDFILVSPDVGKAFDSVRLDSVLKSVEKIFPDVLPYFNKYVGDTQVISYENFMLYVKSGVNQGCSLSPVVWDMVFFDAIVDHFKVAEENNLLEFIAQYADNLFYVVEKENIDSFLVWYEASTLSLKKENMYLVNKEIASNFKINRKMEKKLNKSLSPSGNMIFVDLKTQSLNVLGVPVSLNTDVIAGFLKEKMSGYLDYISNSRKMLMTDPQAWCYALRVSFSTKWNHILSCVNPSVIDLDTWQKWEKELVDIILKALGAETNEARLRSQESIVDFLLLPLAWGGIGVLPPLMEAVCGYLNATSFDDELFNQALNDLLPFLSIRSNVIKKLRQASQTGNKDNLHAQLVNAIVTKKVNDLKTTYTATQKKAVQVISAPESRSLLSAYIDPSLRMKALEFNTKISHNYRILRVPMDPVLKHFHCRACERNFQANESLDHILQCNYRSFYGVVDKRHNMVRDEFKKSAITVGAMGVQAVKEPVAGSIANRRKQQRDSVKRGDLCCELSLKEGPTTVMIDFLGTHVPMDKSIEKHISDSYKNKLSEYKNLRNAVSLILPAVFTAQGIFSGKFKFLILKFKELAKANDRKFKMKHFVQRLQVIIARALSGCVENCFMPGRCRSA
jgi:hypothetical protein